MRITTPIGVAALLVAGAAHAAVQTNGALDSGRRLFEARQFAEATKVLSPIGAASGEAAILLCRIAYDERRTNDALKWGEKAIALLPDSAPAHLWLGRAYIQQLTGANILRQPGIAGRARARFDRAVELDAKYFDAREARTQYYLNAPAIGGGGVGKARAEAEVARKLDAYRGGLLRGDVEQHDKQIAAAEREFANLIAAYPDSSAPFNRLVNLLQTAKRFSEAFSVIDARIARLPGDGSARYQLGRAAALSGERLEQGEAALRAFIATRDFTIAPEAYVHHRLAMILEKRKDMSGALREYQTALRLDPKLEDAKAGIKRLGG